MSADDQPHPHDRDSDHARTHTHGHHERGSETTDERRLGFAFVIIFLFMLVEAFGGVIAGSLALLADAGHMASDAAALGMSWAALRIGRRPADAARTYGYRRIEVLVAYSNGCTLFLVAGWIVFEAIRRFATPVPVLGGTMLVVAIAGLFANALALFLLHGGNRDSLNLRSAWLHVLGDLLGFVVAIIAAGIILRTGWSPIDPILSVLIALLILKSAASIVKASAHILLEGTPAGLDLEALRRDLAAAVPGVAEVHHVHAWSLTSEQIMITLHVRCRPDADPTSVIRAINERLKARYRIDHSTIQIEAEDCADGHHR
ncbi:MAG TPA: cation diffusion facilitator family transporter [Xanthobacteraceae bacterium]